MSHFLKQRILMLSLLVMSMTLLNSLKSVAAAPVHLDHKGERWAATTMRKMTTEEKVGQLIMVWAKVQYLNQDSPEMNQLRLDMAKYHVGGF